MRGGPRPPELTGRLLERALPADVRPDVLGDLEEVYRRRVESHGRMRAGFWYWREALSFSVRFLWERIRERDAPPASKPGRRPVTPAGSSGRRAAERPDPTKMRMRTHGTRNGRMKGTLEAWKRDFAHAARGLLRAPGFAAVTVATLTLAIGANTAIFSVVDAVLINPLPFPDSDRLVAIWASAPGADLPGPASVGTEFFIQYDEQADLLEDLGFYNSSQTTVRSEDRADRLFVQAVNPSFFSTLGAPPALGRVPTEADDEQTVAVISHALWTNWFGGDPSVINRTLEVSGDLVTVIGVMGPEFRFLDERTSVWVHDLVTNPENPTPGGFNLGLVGRMRPGVSHADLAAQLDVLAARLPERFGGSPRYAEIMEQHQSIVRSLEEQLIGDLATPLWILLGTVGVVLLIACANVANLFVVRAESRRRELAVRRAIGAGRIGLVRAQMAEALLLAALGGVGGAVLAWVGVPVLVRAAPERVPNVDAAGLDPTALLFTAGVALLAAFLFGLLPAIRFSNPGLAGGLRQSGRVGEPPGRLGRNALVVAQTASALVLLVAAGLLVRSFVELTRVDPGYDTEDIFTFQIAPELEDGPAYARFHQAFLDRVAALPGVESVGLSALLPLDEGAASGRFATERIEATGEDPPRLNYTVIGGDYFETMRIDLEDGRLFEPADRSGALASAVVSRSAAERLWPGENPLGQRLRPAGSEIPWVTVVGVVEDIYLRDLRQAERDPMIYVPLSTALPVGSPAYVVKSERAGSLAPAIRDLVREDAPESPMYRIFTMEQLVARAMGRLSFTTVMLAIAAGLALVLGAVGIYGVLSYVVSQRTREIAVRMALGARTPELRRMVVFQGGRVTLVGIALGLLGAFGATRVLGTMLFGVEPLDVPTFAGMAAVMLGVAVLASYVPARRASAVDPMESLRME